MGEGFAMTRGYLLAVGVLGWSLSTAQAQPRVEAALKANGWHTNYASARTAARANGKPMFVVFRCQP
jgi:hypothetical protein